MQNEDNPPEFLSLQAATDLFEQPISQDELEHVALLEDAVVSTRSDLQTKLRLGVSVEPGALCADPHALALPISRSVRKSTDSQGAMATAQSPNRASGRTEPAFEGGLTFGELRLLRNLMVDGEFIPERLYGIVDRFERIANELFSAERDRMASIGCFTMARSLRRRAKFALYVRRVRLMIALHDWGVTRVRGCILEGIYELNRQYFAVRGQPI